MVLKREGFQLISRHCGSALWIVGGLMALNKRMLCSSFHGFSHLSEAKEGRGVDKRFLVEMPMAIGASSKGSLCFRCCLDRHNGVYRKTNDEVGKAHAIAPLRHLIPDSNVIFGENVNPELLNGHGASRHGNPLGFSGHLRPAKMVVAVDVDEVLGSFLSALNKFIADHYASYHSLSEYYVYEFFKIWNCSRTEANIRVHEFFKTPYFKKGIHPIPGAQYTLQKLSTFCDLSVVTSRQNAIKDHTIEWIEKHYPGLFQEIHFGNHFALDGQSRQKSEICRSLGAQVLIDDNPRYAVECAEVGIKVLLFDYDNSYPWCKSDLAASHPLIAKVHNWQEVEQHLVSGVMSAD